MANRNTLHISKKEEFEKFLKEKGYTICPKTNIYEVIRAKNGKRTVLVYRKSNAKEHLSFRDKDYDLVKEFLRKG